MKIDVSWLILLLFCILGIYIFYKYFLRAYNELNTRNRICDTVLYGSIIILCVVEIFFCVITPFVK
jgi:hypothetical protein